MSAQILPVALAQDDEGSVYSTAFTINLSTLLDDQEWVENILASDPDVLSATQTRMFSKIARHILGSRLLPIDQEGEEEYDDDQAGEKSSPNKRKWKGRSALTRNPWQRVMAIKVLSLPEEFNCLNAEDFSIKEWMESYTISIDDLFCKQGWTAGDSFQACYRFTLALQARRVEDQARQCFSFLLWYDMVQLIRAGCTRIGPLVKEDVIEFLRPMGVLGLQGLNAADVRNNLNRWSNIGKKLARLCDRLDIGCLFILARHLSEDFLRTKCTSEGLYYTAAIEHLDSLQIKTLACQTGCTIQGLKLREALMAPFREAREQAMRAV